MISDLRNIYIGDSSIDRIYQGSDLVYVDGHPDILLEYLQADEDSSTGGSSGQTRVYFDTGVPLDHGYGVEISWQLPTTHTTARDSVIFGAQTTGHSYYIMSPTSAGKQVRYTNASNTTPDITMNSTGMTLAATCNSTSQNIKLSTGYSATATASASGNFSKNAYLFALNNNGSVSTYANAGTKIFYVKMITNKNQRLIRFYVPVLHWDGSKYVPCFLDKENNTYIYNKGTGTLYYKIKNDYVLDWIGTSETASGESPHVWFNTGVNIKTYMTHHLSFINGGSGTASENYIVGARKSGSIKYGVFCPLNSTNTITFATSTSSSNFVAFDASSNLNVPNRNYIVTASHWAGGTAKVMHVRELASSPAVNGLFTDSASTSEVASTVYGTPLGIFGINVDDGGRVNNKAGTKLRYLCTGDSIVNPSAVYNFIPVLHNGVPAFYDVKNKTYKYNEGTDKPAIKFLYPEVQNAHEDIEIRGIASAAVYDGTSKDVTFALNSTYKTSVDTEIFVDLFFDESAINGTYNEIFATGDEEACYDLAYYVGNNNKVFSFAMGNYSEDEEVIITYTASTVVAQQIYTVYAASYSHVPHIQVDNGDLRSASTSVPSANYANQNLNIFTNYSRGGIYVKELKWYDDDDLENTFTAVLHWNGSKYVPCFKNVARNSSTPTYIYNTGTGTPAYLI